MSPCVSSLMSHDRVSPRARLLCHAVAVSELGFGGSPLKSQGLLIAQLVKNLPAMQKTWVRLLGQEDPLEKGMATHSSILVWRIPRAEEPGGLQCMESQESDTTERLNHQQSFQLGQCGWRGAGIGRGNLNTSLQVVLGFPFRLGTHC